MAVSSDCKTFLAFHTIGLNYSIKYAGKNKHTNKQTNKQKILRKTKLWLLKQARCNTKNRALVIKTNTRYYKKPRLLF
jgi:hypothetical protein